VVEFSSDTELSKRGKYRIKTTIQEGAFAVSGENTIQHEDCNKIKNIIENEIKALNSWVLDRGGIIGHVKGFLSANNHSVMISSTGDEVYCHTHESAGSINEDVQVSLVLIVFNVSQLGLEEQLIAIFDRLEDDQESPRRIGGDTERRSDWKFELHR
jgi:hypothetical protein